MLKPPVAQFALTTIPNSEIEVNAGKKFDSVIGVFTVDIPALEAQTSVQVNRKFIFTIVYKPLHVINC